MVVGVEEVVGEASWMRVEVPTAVKMTSFLPPLGSCFWVNMTSGSKVQKGLAMSEIDQFIIMIRLHPIL